MITLYRLIKQRLLSRSERICSRAAIKLPTMRCAGHSGRAGQLAIQIDQQRWPLHYFEKRRLC